MKNGGGIALFLTLFWLISASGIVFDANRYAIETLNNPRYPLDLLLLRVITVSLQAKSVCAHSVL